LDPGAAKLATPAPWFIQHRSPAGDALSVPIRHDRRQSSSRTRIQAGGRASLPLRPAWGKSQRAGESRWWIYFILRHASFSAAGRAILAPARFFYSKIICEASGTCPVAI